MVATGVATGTAGLCVVVLVSGRLPYDGWPSNHVPGSADGRAVLQAPLAQVVRVPVVPHPRRVRRVTLSAFAVRRAAARDIRRATVVRRGTARPLGGAPAATPTPSPITLPAPTPAPPVTPTLVRGTAEQTSERVRQTGRTLGVAPVSEPVADAVDQVAKLLP